MSLEEALQVVDKLERGRVFFINLLGGEPLLLKWLPQFLAYVGEKKIGLNITTTGWGLREDTAKNLAKFHNIAVSVSLHGGNAPTVARLTGRSDALAAGIRAIKLLVKYGTNVGVGYTVNRLNKGEVPQMLRMVDKLGVRVVGLRHFLAVGRGAMNESALSISTEEFLQVVKNALSLKKGLRNIQSLQAFGGFCFVWFRGTVPKSKLGRLLLRFCAAGITKFDVFPDGSVYPCFALCDERFGAGNLLRETLSRIWASKVFCELRKRDLPEECSGCSHSKVCYGGCLGYSYQKSGELTKDPRCPR
jgi:radical SAM protein with 4Fe4S-binding SPASM domain